MRNEKEEKNAVILILTAVLERALGLAISICIARLLGVKSFGLIAYAYSISQMFLLVSAFGFDRLTLRELSRKPSRASLFLVDITTIRIALFIPLSILCGLVEFLRSNSAMSTFIVIVVFYIAAADQHLSFGFSFFRAIQKMERESILRLTAAFLSLSTGIGVLLLGFGIEVLIVTRLLIVFICLCVAMIWIKNHFQITISKPRYRSIKALIRKSAPLAAIQIFIIIYGSLNLVILGLMHGDLETGYYSAAHRIIMVFNMIPGAIVGATFPVISKHHNARPLFLASYNKAVRYLVLLAVPITTGTWLVGPKVVNMIYGASYEQSGIVIKLMALGFIPNYLNWIMNAALISTNKEKLVLSSVIVGAATCLVASLTLIPTWGAAGAAGALSLTSFMVFLFLFIILFAENCTLGKLLTLVRSLIAATLMIGVILWLTNIQVFVLIGISILIYVTSLFLIGEINQGEIKRVRTAFKNYG